MPIRKISRAVQEGYVEKFSRVWMGPGGIVFGFGSAFAIFCAVIGAVTASWELILMSGILLLTSICALAFAIFIEYGPLRFDPPEVVTPEENELDERVRYGRLHPGKPFVICGILVTAVSGALALTGIYAPWPLAAGFAGFGLAALGLLLEADVAVYRLGLLNQEKDDAPPKRTRPTRPRTPTPGTPR